VDLLPESVRNDRRLRRSIRWRVAGLKLLLRTCVRRRPAQHYGTAYRELWTLDAPIARRLSEQCRLQGVSAHAAISMALMLAFRAVCGPRRITRCIAPVDMRRVLPALAADSLFAVAPTIVLPPGAPYDDDSSVRACCRRRCNSSCSVSRRASIAISLAWSSCMMCSTGW
jgi:hypothetical protein